MSDQIMVNGNQLSWGSITLKIAGVAYTGFTSISFADKRERVKAYGMGRHHAPRGRSRGKYQTDPVKLVGWTGSVQLAREALAAQAPENKKAYGDVEFQTVVQYVEPGEPGITIVLDRCVWVGNNTSNEESADPLKEEVEIDCMLIRRNDLVLFDNSEAGI